MSAALDTLPGVREAAEAMARESWEAMRAVGAEINARTELPTTRPMEAWEDTSASIRGWWCAMTLRLLCDLDRPASLDWWTRWLADRKGAKVSGNAPAWELVGFDGDTSMWCLTVTALALGDEDYEYEFVLGAEFVGKPREALRAACLAAGGAS